MKLFPKIIKFFSSLYPNPTKTNYSLLFYRFKRFNQDGSALVMAAIFMVVATTMITIGMRLISVSSRESKQVELYLGEAENAARAGLIDGLGWFRRQNKLMKGYVSPVQAGQTPTPMPGVSYYDQIFQPVHDNLHPEFSDTMDETIGLVNEYPVDAGSTTQNAVFYARYELKRQKDPNHPNPSQTMTPHTTATITCTPDPYAVHDISGNRVTSEINGDGYVWYLQSTGYVYKRVDKTQDAYGNWVVPFNMPPNKIVASAKVATELRKMSLNLPQATPNSGVTAWGAVYINATNMITLANDQTLLNAAVSSSGTYSSVGFNAPITVASSFTPTFTRTFTNTPTPANTPTPTLTNTPQPTGSCIDATLGGEVSPMQEVTGATNYIYSSSTGSGSKDFLINVTACGRYKINAKVWRPDSSHYRWDVQLQEKLDNNGKGNSTYSISGSNATWITQDVTDNTGAVRNWDLPVGTYTITWTGNDKNVRLSCFQLVLVSSIGCPPTFTRTFTPTITRTPTPTLSPTYTFTPAPTFTPNLSCLDPVGATSVNCQAPSGALCLGPLQNINELLDTKIFGGLTLTDLRFISDYRGDATTPLNILSDWKLSYFEGNLTYGSGNAAPYDRLHSTGILVVNGNLTLNGGNGSTILPSSFSGIVFVTGNLIVRDGSEIAGCVIMGHSSSGGGGTVTLNGSGGNRGTITLNPGLVGTAMKLVAQYREDITARKTLLAIPGL